MTLQKHIATPHFEKGVCLNNQTVGNLKKYLDRFPDDAEVVIVAANKEGNYHHWDCWIGCNFEYQESHKRVVLHTGFVKDTYHS